MLVPVELGLEVMVVDVVLVGVVVGLVSGVVLVVREVVGVLNLHALNVPSRADSTASFSISTTPAHSVTVRYPRGVCPKSSAPILGAYAATSKFIASITSS